MNTVKLALILVSCAIVLLGQGKQNTVQTGVINASGAVWLPPTATFAAAPSTPLMGAVYIFTDASSVGTCSGGGTALATCRWSGSSWQATGGGSAPSGEDAPIWSGGTQVQRLIQCAVGTVSYTALTAAAATQEITIQTGAGGTGIPGNVRWEHVLVSETTQFAGVTGLTVSMGRTGSTDYELTGTQVALGVSSGDANYWYATPASPQLGTVYNVVLGFKVSSGTLSTASAGSLTWEMCGYAAR